MDRATISDILDECGTLLELKGENPFRSNAYHNAARAVNQLTGDIRAMLQSGELSKVKGLGATMIEKITELLDHGQLTFHEKLRAEIPEGLIDMLRIPGFGPKRIKQVHDALGIETIESLKSACQDGSLASLKGFGEKSAKKILEGIDFLAAAGKRVLLPTALELAERVKQRLKAIPSVRRVEICGSLRRGKETIGDIDLLVSSDDPGPIMSAFVTQPEVQTVLGQGETKSSVIMTPGLQADLRVVDDSQFPFALHYFTGSKEHNVAIRGRAQERGYKLNEYELKSATSSIACKDESDIFRALGLDYIPPELREDGGEIESAENHSLPVLIADSDIKGVFHCHTNESDGHATLEEMVEAARAFGYEYLGIADHSKTAFYANGLSPERLRDQIERIDRLQSRLKGFRIFKGIESDILADGSLDYEDDLLVELDYVVASIHQPMNMTSEAMTARILRAIKHPACTMLGHATGRLLLMREAYPVDLDAILQEAARTGTMIEINANPRRLDIDAQWCKRARDLGVTFVINPDAHATSGFEDMHFGVLTARRGWLEKKHVFNTHSAADAAKLLAARKRTRMSERR